MKTFVVPVFWEVQAESADHARAFVIEQLDEIEFDAGERLDAIRIGNADEVKQSRHIAKDNR